MSNKIFNTVNIEMPKKCGTCSEFSAKAETVKFHADGQVYTSETTVRCEHKNICDRIEQKIKDENEPNGMPRFGT